MIRSWFQNGNSDPDPINPLLFLFLTFLLVLHTTLLVTYFILDCVFFFFLFSLLYLISQLCLTLCNPHGLQPTRFLCPWEFSRQVYWSGSSCPPPGDLPDSGIELMSPAFPALQAGSLLLAQPGWEAHILHQDFSNINTCTRIHLRILEKFRLWSGGSGKGLWDSEFLS